MEICKYTCEHQDMPRPATGPTPNRNLRSPDHIWKPALERAHAEGKSLTEVINRFLARYGSQPPRRRPPGEETGDET